jgi:tripartite-type tricarboxylate transporter receptor subunit TctC
VLASPKLRESMEKQGVELKFTPADEFGKMIDQEFTSWAKVVQAAKIKLH